MASLPREIPFNTEMSNRILPWLMAAMIYLLLLFLSGFYILTEETSDLPSSKLSLAFPIKNNQDLNKVLLCLETFPAFNKTPFLKQGEINIKEDFLHFHALNTQEQETLFSSESLKSLEEHLLYYGFDKGVRLFPSSSFYGSEEILKPFFLILIAFFTCSTLLINLLVFYHSLKNHQHIIKVLMWVGATPRYLRKLFYKRSTFLILKGTSLAILFMALTSYILYNMGLYKFTLQNFNYYTLVCLFACVPLTLSFITFVCIRSLIFFSIDENLK